MKRKPYNRRKPSVRSDPSPYPKGWNRKRVETLVDYYDNQSDEEAIAEAEAAYKDRHSAMIQIPIRLVPRVRKLLARRAG